MERRENAMDEWRRDGRCCGSRSGEQASFMSRDPPSLVIDDVAVVTAAARLHSPLLVSNTYRLCSGLVAGGAWAWKRLWCCLWCCSLTAVISGLEVSLVIPSTCFRIGILPSWETLARKHHKPNCPNSLSLL